MGIIHETDQYKIFEEETTLEDSTDVCRQLTIQYEGEKVFVFTFAFGELKHFRGYDKNDSSIDNE